MFNQSTNNDTNRWKTVLCPTKKRAAQIVVSKAGLKTSCTPAAVFLFLPRSVPASSPRFGTSVFLYRMPLPCVSNMGPLNLPRASFTRCSRYALTFTLHAVYIDFLHMSPFCHFMDNFFYGRDRNRTDHRIGKEKGPSSLQSHS